MRRFPTGLFLALALPACSAPDYVNSDYVCSRGESAWVCINARDVRAFDPRLDDVSVSVSNVEGMHAYGAMIGDSLVASYDPRAEGYLDSLNRVVNVRGQFRKVERDALDRESLVMIRFWVGDDPSWLRG